MKNISKFTIIIVFLFSGLFTISLNAQGFSETRISIDEILFDYDVLIYPNPVTDNKFYVKSEHIIKKVEVINVLGQNIKTVNNETNVAYNIYVELGDVKKGMYMVKIIFADKKTIIKKIIVK